MRIRIPLTAPVLLLSLLAGCATAPLGPTSRVMPAPGKPFEVFRHDDAECRQFAAQSVGTSRNEAAADNMAGSMALGTVVGATAGALIGGQRGAGVGAGAGLLAGTAHGSGQSAYAGSDAQQRYNLAYDQCMYAKGNQVLGYGAVPNRGYLMPPPPPYR